MRGVRVLACLWFMKTFVRRSSAVSWEEGGGERVTNRLHDSLPLGEGPKGSGF
jgi:hypothetical protein